VLGSASIAWAQIDPYPRSLLQLGYDQSLPGKGPQALYAYYYYNNPDFLRTNDAAVAFAKSFFDAGKPVAVICHGPWTLIEADVVRGRTITSWPSVKTDLTNAGANWTDDEVVECPRGPNTLVSSRKPDDLPAFCNTLVEAFGGDTS
jgi:protease I